MTNPAIWISIVGVILSLGIEDGPNWGFFFIFLILFILSLVYNWARNKTYAENMASSLELGMLLSSDIAKRMVEFFNLYDAMMRDVTVGPELGRYRVIGKNEICMNVTTDKKLSYEEAAELASAYISLTYDIFDKFLVFDEKLIKRSIVRHRMIGFDKEVKYLQEMLDNKKTGPTKSDIALCKNIVFEINIEQNNSAWHERNLFTFHITDRDLFVGR